MFYSAARRSGLMMLAVFVSLMSLGMQSFPAGSVICLEQQGHVALECAESACCDSMLGAQGQPQPVSATTGAISCTKCIDFYLPHDRFDVVQDPSVMMPVLAPELVLIAVIDWPQSYRLAPLRVSVDRRPPHLVQIASTVIRC